MATTTQKQPDPPPQPRTRAAVSKERLLAMAITDVIKEADAAKPKFTGPAVEKARSMVKEFNEKFLKPITDRVAEIQGEMQAAVRDPLKIDPTKLQALARELARLQNKLKVTQG